MQTHLTDGGAHSLKEVHVKLCSCGGGGGAGGSDNVSGIQLSRRMSKHTSHRLFSGQNCYKFSSSYTAPYIPHSTCRYLHNPDLLWIVNRQRSNSTSQSLFDHPCILYLPYGHVHVQCTLTQYRLPHMYMQVVLASSPGLPASRGCRMKLQDLGTRLGSTKPQHILTSD